MKEPPFIMNGGSFFIRSKRPPENTFMSPLWQVEKNARETA